MESEFEHMADLVLVILCVAGGMLMWQTHGWLMAVSSIMFAAGGTLLVFHWGAVHMRRMGEDGRRCARHDCPPPTRASCPR